MHLATCTSQSSATVMQRLCRHALRTSFGDPDREAIAAVTRAWGRGNGSGRAVTAPVLAREHSETPSRGDGGGSRGRGWGAGWFWYATGAARVVPSCRGARCQATAIRSTLLA